jgi:hypothetical protein
MEVADLGPVGIAERSERQATKAKAIAFWNLNKGSISKEQWPQFSLIALA